MSCSFCLLLSSTERQILHRGFNVEIGNMRCRVTRCFSTNSSFLSSKKESWLELAYGMFFWTKDYHQLYHFDIIPFSSVRCLPASNSLVLPLHEAGRILFLSATSPNHAVLMILGRS